MTSIAHKVRIGNILVDNLTFTEAVDRILTLAKTNRPASVVTPNADHMVELRYNKRFSDAYANAALTVADGTPLIWASKWLGTPLKERVTGADLLIGLCAAGASEGLQIFLLGAPPGVADLAAARLVGLYPGLVIAGTHCPPYGFENMPGENERIISLIQNSKPDLVFVAFGCPKQELWIDSHLHCFEKGVFLGIGAAISFAAGRDKRAPMFLQKWGMEWFYRWTRDPLRLTRRYLRDFVFFAIAIETWRKNRRPLASAPTDQP